MLVQTENSQQIAERIRAGDISAYNALLESHWSALVRYAMGLTRSWDDAQDLAQEAFARVCERRYGLNAAGSLRGYLYQIARNLAISEKRQRARHDRLNRQHSMLRAAPSTPARELETEELREVLD